VILLGQRVGSNVLPHTTNLKTFNIATKVRQGEVLSDVGLGEKERKVAKAQIIIRQQF
jgi:hypothetical protein